MKYRVKVNSLQKVEELMQQIYDDSQKHLNFINDEINKLITSTNLSKLTMDEKGKYSKALHDYSIDKEKVLRLKVDVAKLMSEIVKQNGDIDKAIDNNKKESSILNLNEIRAAVKNSDKPTEIKIKK